MENQPTNIVNELEELLNKQMAPPHLTDSSDALNKANDFYNEMVARGLIKKRGYTLLGIEDYHLFHPKYNS